MFNTKAIPLRLNISSIEKGGNLLGIYSKDSKTKDPCTSMLTAAGLTTAKLWNQLRCLSSEKVDKENVLYIHNGILLIHD